MPYFAALDADRHVVNIVAAARKDDLLRTVSHGIGVEGDYAEGISHETVLAAPHRQDEGYAEPIWVPTPVHLKAHGASDFIEMTDETGRAVIGMKFDGDRFVPGDRPFASASNDALVQEARARGLIAAPQN